MQYRDSLLDWSFPLGSWFGLRLRCSPLLLLVPVILGLQRWDAQLAAVVGLCLIASVLIHELAHIFAIRLTGGVVSETLLWPLGGITRVSLMSPSAAPYAASIAGPLVNLFVAVLCVTGLTQHDIRWALLDVLSLPDVDFESEFGRGLLSILFYTNWLLVVANLLPALPMDGGRVLDRVLTARLGGSLGQQTASRAGMFIGLTVLVAALLLESVWLCAFAAGLIAFNLRDSFRHQASDTFDDSFMGYDFSQGYTSLERSVPTEVEAEVRQGLFQRWMARRRAWRDERQRARALEAERELDFLLAKVHTYGINSLTESEKRTLKRASTRYRGRAKE